MELEKTFNISVRIMYNVPRDCHKYLIEPITEQPHLKFILIKTFLNFRKQVLDGPKSIVKNMFNICQYNSSTITGSNLRQIVLLCKKPSINHIESTDIDSLEYTPIPENEQWRVSVAKDLLEARHHGDFLPGFTQEEITDMLNFVCSR